jgi:hypothetical protein
VFIQTNPQGGSATKQGKREMSAGIPSAFSRKAVAEFGFAAATLSFADEKGGAAGAEVGFAVTKGGFADENAGWAHENRVLEMKIWLLQRAETVVP